MAIGPGSILEARVFQRLQGQQVLNVTHFEVLEEGAGVTTLTGFAQPFGELWYELFSEVQSNLLTYERVELYEVNGIEIDTYSWPTPPAGVQGGELLGTFEAVSVQLLRGSRATRHGWKRFAGVTEPMAVGGVLTAGLQVDYAVAASTMFNSIVNLQDAVIPSRFINVRAIIWGGNDPAYPLGRFSDIVSVQVKNLISTQNTRKIGRGS